MRARFMVAIGLVTACAVDNPLFGATESGGAGGGGTQGDSEQPATSQGLTSGSTAVGGTMGDASNGMTAADANDDDDDDDDDDADSGTPMPPIDDCEGLQEFPIAPGAPPHTPQAAMFDDAARVFFLDDGVGTVLVAEFPFVTDPTIAGFQDLQGTMLLAGGNGVDVGIAVGVMSPELLLGDVDYDFGASIGLPGMDLPHGGLGKVLDTWVVPTLSFGTFNVHTTGGAIPTTTYVDDMVLWVDGDGTNEGVAYVYERSSALPTCRIIPYTDNGAFGSNSTAAGQECHTPTVSYDPALGGLVVYARETSAEIRGIEIDADANATPTQMDHFPIVAGKGVDHPEVVRLPVSGNYWVVFDQGPELTAVVLDGKDPATTVGGPKTFGGQADGNLQAFLVDDHPAVAFHTQEGAYGAGVHVVVDCEVL